MEAAVAERGQITLPKAVNDTLRHLRGSYKPAEGFETTDDAMRALLGRAPGDVYPAPADAAA